MHTIEYLMIWNGHKNAKMLRYFEQVNKLFEFRNAAGFQDFRYGYLRSLIHSINRLTVP